MPCFHSGSRCARSRIHSWSPARAFRLRFHSASGSLSHRDLRTQIDTYFTAICAHMAGGCSLAPGGFNEVQSLPLPRGHHTRCSLLTHTHLVKGTLPSLECSSRNHPVLRASHCRRDGPHPSKFWLNARMHYCSLESLKTVKLARKRRCTSFVIQQVRVLDGARCISCSNRRRCVELLSDKVLHCHHQCPASSESTFGACTLSLHEPVDNCKFPRLLLSARAYICLLYTSDAADE